MENKTEPVLSEEQKQALLAAEHGQKRGFSETLVSQDLSDEQYDEASKLFKRETGESYSVKTMKNMCGTARYVRDPKSGSSFRQGTYRWLPGVSFTAHQVAWENRMPYADLVEADKKHMADHDGKHITVAALRVQKQRKPDPDGHVAACIDALLDDYLSGGQTSKRPSHADQVKLGDGLRVAAEVYALDVNGKRDEAKAAARKLKASLVQQATEKMHPARRIVQKKAAA